MACPKNIFNIVFLVALLVVTVLSSTVPITSDNVQELKLQREGRFYGGANANAFASATATGSGLGFPGYGMGGASAIASANAGATGFGYPYGK